MKLIKKEQSNGSSTANKTSIENHKKAAKHHEAGNHEKACECTVKAHGHHCLASKAQREDVKHHALNK